MQLGDAPLREAKREPDQLEIHVLEIMPLHDLLLALWQRLDDEQQALPQALQLKHSIRVECLGFGAQSGVLQREAQRESDGDLDQLLQRLGRAARASDDRLDALFFHLLPAGMLGGLLGRALQTA